eukprot:2839701-Rhodomonas_salina.2
MLLCGVRYGPRICCYAVSGTDLGYAAMRCPAMLLCGVRYEPRLCCNAVSGTDQGYAASRTRRIALCSEHKSLFSQVSPQQMLSPRAPFNRYQQCGVCVLISRAHGGWRGAGVGVPDMEQIGIPSTANAHAQSTTTTCRFHTAPANAPLIRVVQNQPGRCGVDLRLTWGVQTGHASPPEVRAPARLQPNARYPRTRLLLDVRYQRCYRP